MSRYEDRTKIPDMTAPSLKGLICLLRNRELWPRGFWWHFSDCSTCAMGLISAYWGIPLPSPPRRVLSERPVELAHYFAQYFGITEDAAESVFLPNYEKDAELVQPEDVADKLAVL